MIPIIKPSLGNEELNNVIEAVRSGWISSKGKFVREFETNFAKYHGMRSGVATSNGTVALNLALNALDVKKDDEIIVPVLTFAATANAVIYCNARPVYVDSHPEYWCIDPEKIEEKITKNTRAIIPVHLYGHPCDMKWIMDIAEDYDLYVIEDAAEAHGAEYKGKKVGSFGDVSCFSFYGNKIITTGEGGICLTGDEELLEKMRILRDHGMNPNKRYWHDVVGFNYRMTNLQAAIGVAQLKKLDNFLKKKRQIAALYKEKLNDLVENNKITPHPQMSWAKCSYWIYSILIEDAYGIETNRLIDNLEIEKIDVRPFFYPLNTMPPYKNSEKFPIAEEISRKGISLPSSIDLTKDDVFEVVECIKNRDSYKNSNVGEMSKNSLLT